MKNKLAVDFEDSGQFSQVEEEKTSKTTGRRKSVAPKIVVCPPVEEMNLSVPEARGGSLLRALGRRLSRRSNDGDSDTSEASCSSDSVSENRTDDRSSCSGSDSGSDLPEPLRRHRSTISFRRVFQRLNLTSRAQSCSPTDYNRTSKKQAEPKRILRPPMTYTYIRGPSGLPTQRVPRRAVYSAGQ